MREPLVHFLLLGAGLFVLAGLLANSEGDGNNRIVVSPGRIEHLVTGFSRTWQRPPTHQELEGLIEDYIKEEVWYREAQAMGLDQDDTVIRRRLRQKMEFLSEDFVATSAPTDAELTAYLDQHSEQFRIGSKISFTHVYLSPDRRGDDVDQDAERLKVDLLINPTPTVDEAIGDPFPLSHEFELLSESQVTNLFGKNFADHVFTLEPHTWSGPIESGYGIHLVFVRERVEGRIPTLEEVRAVVQREWESTTRREAKKSLYQELRDQYTVTVEYPEELRQGNSISPGSGKTE
ncbi:MAG: peptidylprolyl isomerase [Nitrospirales bacterium]